MHAAVEPHPNLRAINPFELNGHRVNDYFHGIYDCFYFNVAAGRHGNDSSVLPNTPRPSRMLKLPKDELDRRLEEALNHPDIKYNSKWYALLKYPINAPQHFDSLLESFHPTPRSFPVNKITIPAYLSCTWCWRLYIWGTFDAYENMASKDKKLALWPPGSPDRPFVQYADETVRWHDYWLKGIDTGIMDEPRIKVFVMGVNKWKFEDEWPLARTKWTKYYLHPKGSLTMAPPQAGGEPDTFVQPAPYLDPSVYCLRYSTGPLHEDMEVTGPMALYLEASIDIDDTNWMIDLVDVDPEGNRQLLSNGYLKAAHRALDQAKSKPYYPVHPRQDPVPVPPGEVIEYAIAMMPTANVFQKGHSMELIIRNQDDILSRLGTWGKYMLPFMRTVTHDIHFGKSYLLLPVIPAS
jgi:predicted acyl esterase